jgi:hypothetical protein
MNLIYKPGSRLVKDKPASEVKAQANDPGIIAHLNAKLSTANAAKTAAITALEDACAQAAREDVAMGSGARQAGAIRDLVDTITRLEGEIEFYNQAVAGLTP